ncbi:YihY family inner membrane protein [Chitinibacteraceae bacterium HSL-7]
MPLVQRLSGFTRFFLHRLVRDRCLPMAGSLTYTTLLAIVPLFTIALTIFAAFPVFSSYAIRFRAFIATMLAPETGGKMVLRYVRQFSENAGQLTAFGMIGLGITALLLMFTIERTFNEIWRVRTPRKLLPRTLLYWATLTLGPVLIALSFSLTSWLMQQTSQFEALTFAEFITGRLGPGLITFSLLTLLYIAVPNCFVPRLHGLSAAAITAVLLEIMKTLFGQYLKAFASYKLVYGTFAAVPIFLLWIYLCWVIVLAGAVLTVSLSYWQQDAWRWGSDHGTRFEQAVRVLATLAAAHATGEVLHINVLRRRVGLGLDTTHGTLEDLARRGWVEVSRDGEWLLAVSPERIGLADIYNHVIAPLSARVEAGLAINIEGMKTALDETLADYLARRDGPVTQDLLALPPQA